MLILSARRTTGRMNDRLTHLSKLHLMLRRAVQQDRHRILESIRD
jgi:hypothetical protein